MEISNQQLTISTYRIRQDTTACAAAARGWLTTDTVSREKTSAERLARG
jgi:hypothetical protein